jgi:hypothetical protein
MSRATFLAQLGLFMKQRRDVGQRAKRENGERPLLERGSNIALHKCAKAELLE